LYPILITIDLGRAFTIKKMILTWASNHATNYQLSRSADNVAYTVFTSKTNGDPMATNAVDTFTLNVANTRYVQIAIIDGYNQGTETFSGSLLEVEIDGPYDYAADYIQVVLPSSLTETTILNPWSQSFSGTIGSFGVVKVDSTSTAGFLTPTGTLVARFSPPTTPGKLLAVPSHLLNYNLPDKQVARFFSSPPILLQKPTPKHLPVKNNVKVQRLLNKTNQGKKLLAHNPLPVRSTRASHL